MPAVYYHVGSKRLARQTWSGMRVCPEGKRHPPFVHFLRHVLNAPAWFNAAVPISTGFFKVRFIKNTFFFFFFFYTISEYGDKCI